MIDQVIKHFGQIDVLINDAEIMIVGPMESFEVKGYDKAKDVMYWGIVSFPHMLPYTASNFPAVGPHKGQLQNS
jgi:NAD(P)-dependent dehydrogenase (short-subunit alcohol dehydrogenase family)